MKNFRELNSEFDNLKKIKQNNIRNEPNGFKRWLKRVWFGIIFPFEGIWFNIRDGRSLLIFAAVFLIVSSEVGVSYIIYGISGNTWFLGIGSACGLFGIGPGTPFLVICVGLTIGIKALLNKIMKRR